MRVWFCPHKLWFPLRCSTGAYAHAASDWHCQRSGGGKADGGASSMRRRQPGQNRSFTASAWVSTKQWDGPLPTPNGIECQTGGVCHQSRNEEGSS
jgi:hypothetical protein